MPQLPRALDWLRPTGRMRAELDRALAGEVQRLDVLVARVSQALYVGAILLGGAIAVAASGALGWGIAGASVGYLGWYSWLVRSLRAHADLRWRRIATTLVDATVPWVFALGLTVSEGPSYALSSWIPPMLFSALLLGGVVRLRPSVSLVAGAASPVLLLALYFGVQRDRLSPFEASLIVNQPPLLFGRAALLALSGGLAALVTAGMRTVVARADVAVRENDLFGKYRIVRRIAEGGMGEVFEAAYCPEGGFTRRVAIKRIHPSRAHQQRFVDAFRAEAELCARLAHPNLVQVMDFGKIGVTYFLAMEFIDGMTLAALSERAAEGGRKLGPDVVGYVGREILAGLEHAHSGARGPDGRPLRVVHRDMCPQNVLVSKNGEVKIADFGLARALRDTSSAQTQTLRGHLGYLAPEQIEHRIVDPRTDLYAVGVVLWELLTGHALFPTRADASGLAAILTHVPKPATLYRPDVDPGWDAFLARAIARDPAERFASAREMSDALGELAGARSEGAGERLAELVEALESQGPAASEGGPDGSPASGLDAA